MDLGDEPIHLGGGEHPSTHEADGLGAEPLTSHCGYQPVPQATFARDPGETEEHVPDRLVRVCSCDGERQGPAVGATGPLPFDERSSFTV